MAKQEVWQNLRGGAGYMVGNALVLTAVAVGLIFRVFNNDEVVYYIAFAIPFYMLVIAAEIVLNFILNLYRPRIPGEVPRPAFDSRMLSLLSAPDSIVRSLNEAVNYQFGFDITSSWGYQLLLRSFVWLIAGRGGAGALNCMVVVEPHQQAIKLQHGKIVGEVHGSGIMWKLPWPIQTAELHDVTQIRELHLTARRADPYRRLSHFWHLDLAETMIE
jgi:modulator of FtsH protease HflK